MQEIKGKQSAKGCLLAFIIWAMFIGPLIQFLGMYAARMEIELKAPALLNSPQWKDSRQFFWLICLSAMALRFGAGYRLKNVHKKETVQFAITALWVSGPIAELLSLFGLWWYFGISMRAPEFIGSIVGSCVWALIWNLYFNKSEQVRVLYKLS